MTPQTAARRLVIALLLGAALGLFYGFLRPLGRRVVLRDSLFLAGWSLIWLELGFGVCGGDLRLGHCWPLFWVPPDGIGCLAGLYIPFFPVFGNLCTKSGLLWPCP